MSSRGAVPQKCSQCHYFFEGGYLRCGPDQEMCLDHGSCPYPGETCPEDYEDLFLIPKKCISCRYLELEIRGCVCRYESEKWGDVPRNLDWGDREPVDLGEKKGNSETKLAFHNFVLRVATGEDTGMIFVLSKDRMVVGRSQVKLPDIEIHEFFAAPWQFTIY